MYKVLIADDHPLFRKALKQVLTDQLTMHVKEAHDYQTTVNTLSEDSDIDLLFLDLKMPGSDGLAAISTIRAQFPNTLVIVVSAEEQQQTISKCVQLGASAFIPKSVDLTEISDAVEQVLDGKQWLPNEYQVSQVEKSESEFIEHIEKLTPHQLKVLGLIANGLLNKQIAYELSISESTVKQHTSAVLKKLGVYNRTQAGVIYKQVMRID